MVEIEVRYPLQVSSADGPVNVMLYYDVSKLKRGKAPWNLHFEGNIVGARSVQLDVNSSVHENGRVSCSGTVWLVGENQYWVQRDG